MLLEQAPHGVAVACPQVIQDFAVLLSGAVGRAAHPHRHDPRPMGLIVKSADKVLQAPVPLQIEQDLVKAVVGLGPRNRQQARLSIAWQRGGPPNQDVDAVSRLFPADPPRALGSKEIGCHYLFSRLGYLSAAIKWACVRSLRDWLGEHIDKPITDYDVRPRV